MQKQFLAAVVASAVAGQAMAITVVDDGTNKFSVGGHVGMRYESQDSDTQAIGDSSRINFQFESRLNEDVTAFARTEWGFDITEHDNFGFSNRLGFVGVKGDFGSVSVGQQWSAFSEVASWTDNFATAGAGTGMDETYGTARAQDALKYNISVNGLNVGAQYQVADAAPETPVAGSRTREHGYQFAVSYDLPMGVSAGVAYNQVQFSEANTDDAKALVAAVKYEQGPVYTAFTYGDYKNYSYINGVEDFTKNARSIEFVAQYQLADNLSVQTGFISLEDKDDSDNKTQHVPVEVVYTTGPVQLSGTYTFEQSETAGEGQKDQFVAQARYYF